MWRVATGLVLGVGLTLAPPVRAEEPAPCAPSREAAPSARAEERSFEVTLTRFARLWEFTQSLVAERERRAFESSTAQYERFAALTRELAERHQAEEERSFDASVSLYLRKRELTQALVREHQHASR